MKRAIQVSSLAACFSLGLVAPGLAAEPIPTGPQNGPPVSEANTSAIKPAEKCLSDLRAFNSQMEKDGYWLGGSGYGYPMSGYAYGMGRPLINGRPEATGIGYLNARPGYEVRTLVAAATILARNGQQKPCEDVLATTHDTYNQYVANMHSGKVPMADASGWWKQQLAAAQPVTSQNSSFRSDQLLGTDVRDPKSEALGSVEDLVLSPQTGKIAYLVIGRGGIFGIGEKYTPVPWENFKVTPNGSLLVLDTNKRTMDGAPQVKRDQFATPGHFDQESQKVDAYWKAHVTDKASN